MRHITTVLTLSYLIRISPAQRTPSPPPAPHGMPVRDQVSRPHETARTHTPGSRILGHAHGSGLPLPSRRVRAEADQRAPSPARPPEPRRAYGRRPVACGQRHPFAPLSRPRSPYPPTQPVAFTPNQYTGALTNHVDLYPGRHLCRLLIRPVTPGAPPARESLPPASVDVHWQDSVFSRHAWCDLGECDRSNRGDGVWHIAERRPSP